jgi:NAD(P)-dependent dehydrogenase (short-subunit alcohol dehydrogenase family)
VKKVLITGAGSGFGKGASLALAARGHQVIATTETDTQADALRSEAPQLRVERVDITTNDVDKLRDMEIDVLINNAGFGQTGPLADVPEAIVRKVFEVNVFGTLRVTQAVLPQMVARGNGRVIIVSSIAGHLAGPAFGPYTMSKFALEGMGKTLRGEMFGQGVDVCLLNPGPYLTGFNDRMADSMWEWFGDDAVSAGSTPLFQMMRQMITEGQMDPQEVVDEMVRLVEAETTEETNFVPASLKEQFGL